MFGVIFYSLLASNCISRVTVGLLKPLYIKKANWLLLFSYSYLDLDYLI